MPDFGVTREQMIESEEKKILKLIQQLNVGETEYYGNFQIRRISKRRCELIQMNGTDMQVAKTVAESLWA